MSGEKERVARGAFNSFLINSLRDLALPQNTDVETLRYAKDILSCLIDEFLQDGAIVGRYESSWNGGLGSSAWRNMPCLPDFLEYAELSRLPEEMQVSEMESVLNRLKGSLKALTRRTTGRAISLPSTFDRTSRFMVFSLGATGDDDDNLPLILSAQGTMLFSALENESETLIAQDEASRLFPKFPSIANNCADLYAMGRSLGIWMLLIGQDLNSIAASPVADSIFQNAATFFTGYIQNENAIEAMERCGLPRRLLLKNTDRDFMLPSGKEGSRRWLISRGMNQHFYGDLYLDFASLGLGMNAPAEVKLRQEYQERYGNKYRWCSELAKHLENQTIDAQV